MFNDSNGVFTSTLFNSSYQKDFTEFNSCRQLDTFEYLYDKSFASKSFSSSPNCNTISFSSKLSSSTSISIATHEFSPKPSELSNETLSSASGLSILPLPIKKSLLPVYDFIGSLLDTNAVVSLKLSLYRFFTITKLLSFET